MYIDKTSSHFDSTMGSKEDYLTMNFTWIGVVKMIRHGRATLGHIMFGAY